MSFDQPSDVVAATDSVDVWVTLTVDSGSSALVFDASMPSPFGFDAADLPAQEYHNESAAYGNDPIDFASYSHVQTNTYYSCSGTFTDVCSPSAYAFNFHTSSEPGRPSFNFLSALSLNPGESISCRAG